MSSSSISFPTEASDPEVEPDSRVTNLTVQKASLLSFKLTGLKKLTSSSNLTAPAFQSHFSPRLTSLAYPLGRYGVLPAYFKQIEVVGREHLPSAGPIILAPTHRSRWDAVLVPYAAGYDVTRRHLRFMVSSDEVRGLQGWLIRRLGGFAVDTRRPTIATLRHGIELLQDGKALVIFPEGNIFRTKTLQPLKPGLARLALQAEVSRPDLGVQVVPMGLSYSNPHVPWQCSVKIQIGSPLAVSDYDLKAPKRSACQLTADLHQALEQLA